MVFIIKYMGRRKKDKEGRNNSTEKEINNNSRNNHVRENNKESRKKRGIRREKIIV